jgi:hypothetical protein
MPLNQPVEDGESDYKPLIKKAVYTGAIATAGSYLLFGEGSSNVNFLNMNVNTALAAGLGGASGSVAGDLLSDYVVNAFEQSKPLQNMEKTIIKSAVSGAGCVATLSVAADVEPNIRLFGLGAASKILGDTVHQQAPVLDMLF